jgi:hypothetical protein
MRDNYTKERQQWLRDMQRPARSEIAWDVIATVLGAALILLAVIAGG